MTSSHSLLRWIGVWLGAFAGVHAATSRPNVLFIVADDLRTNLRCYDDLVAVTPNIDRLAQRGILFERAYAQQALCNPSRASVLTGRRPDTVRVWSLATHFRETLPDVVTLPQFFKEQGYFTQDIGKIFHNWHTKAQGDAISWSVPAVLFFAQHESDVAVIPGGGVAPPNLARVHGAEQRDVPDEAYFDGRVAAESIKALRTFRETGKPFFLAVGFWKPHTPYNPPKKYWDLYRREDIPLPRNPHPPVGAPAMALHHQFEGLNPANDDEVRELRHAYYAATSYADAQLGRVVDELDRLGLAENTVIVFWSDHGVHLGEHGLWGKTSNFEFDTHIPLIVAAPGMKNKGSRSKAMVELLDIYPTLVELCGLPASQGIEGTSLRPVLEHPEGSIRPAAFSQHPRPARLDKAAGEAMGYTMNDGRYRYTEWRDWKSARVLAVELYDHDADPDETQNLAGDLKTIEKQNALAAQLGQEFPPRGLPAP